MIRMRHIARLVLAGIALTLACMGCSDRVVRTSKETYSKAYSKSKAAYSKAYSKSKEAYSKVANRITGTEERASEPPPPPPEEEEEVEVFGPKEF
jgi:hypothetical protein